MMNLLLYVVDVYSPFSFLVVKTMVTFSADAGLMTYNLVMLSHVASSVVEFAKSQVEWMSDKILKFVFSNLDVFF